MSEPQRLALAFDVVGRFRKRLESVVRGREPVIDLVLIALFAVLFTGRWPEGMRSFVLNVIRYQLRFEAYHVLLTDRYPPFALG